jgi:hypothetical protein
MRIPGGSRSFLVLSAAALYFSLSFCPKGSAQSQSQPCTSGSAPNSTASATNSTPANPNTVAGAADNTKQAFKNLGSVFKKKDSNAASTASSTAASTAPCIPAAMPTPAGSPAATPAAAAASPAAQPAASGSQGAAAPWSPGDAAAPPAAPKAAATATAFTGTLDPSKLPDIVGIHLGMTIDEAMAILKKMHGGNINLTSAGNPTNYTRAGYQLNVNPPAGDSFQVDYTFPPGAQRVVAISHQSQYYPQVSHANMVEGLRGKYGKETLAIAGPAPAKAGEDARITQMIWLFDENGKVLPPGPVTNLSPYGCSMDHYGSNGVAIMTMVNAYMRNALPAPTFCDSLIILNVAFGASETVNLSQTFIIENGLLLRSVKTTGDYQAEQAKKQHDQQLQQANQAKPTL